MCLVSYLVQVDNDHLLLISFQNRPKCCEKAFSALPYRHVSLLRSQKSYSSLSLFK